jgi:hypothetical protein
MTIAHLQNYGNPLPVLKLLWPLQILTLPRWCGNIDRLRDLCVSAKKPSTLEDFKLFYDELAFSLKPTNRIRRNRAVVATK